MSVVKIIREAPVQLPISKVVLELTEKQARFIKYLAACTAGTSLGGDERAADSLYNALSDIDCNVDFNVRFE